MFKHGLLLLWLFFQNGPVLSYSIDAFCSPSTSEMGHRFRLIITVSVVYEYHGWLFPPSSSGLVSSGVMTTLMQVYSRVFIVWFILEGVSGVSENVGLLLVCLAWGITEVIRYSYYFCALLNRIPYALQWCR